MNIEYFNIPSLRTRILGAGKRRYSLQKRLITSSCNYEFELEMLIET